MKFSSRNIRINDNGLVPPKHPVQHLPQNFGLNKYIVIFWDDVMSAPENDRGTSLFLTMYIVSALEIDACNFNVDIQT